MAGTGYSKGTLSSKLVRISSSERLSGTTTNFTFDFGQNLQQVKKLSIETVNFFNNFYNIDQNNNQYSATTNVDSKSFTIPAGRYTVGSLLDVIGTQISGMTSSPDFSWDQDPITNLVSLTLTPGVVTSLSLIPVDATTFPFFYLGFDATTTLTMVSPNLTVTATDFPKMYGPSMVFIKSSFLAPANAFDQKGQISDILVGVPVTAPYTALNSWRCLEDTLCEIDYGRPRQLNQVDIVLQDREGNILDLHGGSLTLGCRIWFNHF